jgi:hypothetical protein
MWATSLRLSVDHLPRRWGFFLEKLLTEGGQRRSELPSRSTGFTALPKTLA